MGIFCMLQIRNVSFKEDKYYIHHSPTIIYSVALPMYPPDSRALKFIINPPNLRLKLKGEHKINLIYSEEEHVSKRSQPFSSSQ